MKTLICMGDSLTEGDEIPAGHTWPELVSNALNVDVTNCGIGGDTTTGMLARFHPEVVARRPAFVLIMGGTNDLWWGQPINTVLANLFSMVFQARHYGVASVIALPPPVNVSLASESDFSPPWAGYDHFTEQLQRLIESIRRYAAESDVVLADLYRPFFSTGNEINARLYMPDGLHPNTEGHQAIATTIGQTFYRNFLFCA